MAEDARNHAVQPHTAQLTAWDVPHAVVAGERFRFTIGVRCSGGCNLGGRTLSLCDEQGTVLGGATLGAEVWPGTEALYFAEVEACAPLDTGIHQWQAKFAGWQAEQPHAEGAFQLTVRIVTAPDCEVTIHVVDGSQQAPVADARVVMHPYRALTDDSGTAKMRVARGQYDLLVSASRYLPACTTVNVTADLLNRTELDADQPWTAADGDFA